MTGNRTLIGTLIVAITVILSVIIAGSALRHRNDGPRTVSVTGSAEQRFTSDLATWSLTLHCLKPTPKEAFEEVERQKEQLLSFLRSHGFTDKEIEVQGADYREETESYYNQNEERYISIHKGYTVTQTLAIKTSDIEKVSKTSKLTGDLISNEISVMVDNPRYYYTELATLKLKLLHDAGENARQRADEIATASKAKLGDLQQSRMGVFQVLGSIANEEYSWGGTLNTSDIEKRATITVTSTFLLD